jgi:hypothetical protein
MNGLLPDGRAELMIEDPPGFVMTAHFPSHSECSLSFDFIHEGEDSKQHFLKRLLMPREQRARGD